MKKKFMGIIVVVLIAAACMFNPMSQLAQEKYAAPDIIDRVISYPVCNDAFWLSHNASNGEF